MRPVTQCPPGEGGRPEGAVCAAAAADSGSECTGGESVET